MILVKIDNNGIVCDLKRHVEIKMASIRTCGHRENRFFIEPGRSLGIGTGKLWMDLDDQVTADSMHQTILSMMYSLKSDDGCPRPRSYSSGSSSCRSRFRTREYNPPPSQVGMGKPPTINPISVANQLNKPRTRCESFPATFVGGVADEERYRTSSEGETTMRRFKNLRFKNNGSASPSSRFRPRVGSQGKRFQHPHYNTFSCHGSYTSSSSLSSIDHQGSSTVSEGMSSDEYSSSPCDHFQKFGRSITPDSTSSAPLYEDMSFTHCTCHHAPPPPSFAPLPLTTTNNMNHDYVNTQPLHCRSHSMDDNLSCGMDASSLSTSPNHLNTECSWQANDSEYSVMVPLSVTEDNYYMHQQTKPTEQPMDTSDDYADMSFPRTSPAGSKQSEINTTEDYAIMTPGKPTTPINVAAKEDSAGYVAMRPYSIAKSLPQDIDLQHRASLTNKFTTGSYSPKSDMSRSPDKVASKLSTSVRKTKQHGFNLENEPSKLVSVESVPESAMPNYCSDNYAVMNSTDFGNAYLEMMPMSMGHQSNTNKGTADLFVGVLSVATSGVKSTLQYPHQLSGTEYTNSLDRKKISKSLKRNKSNNSHKIDRKMSLKIITDTKQEDMGSSSSLGGEYVNIDYQKASLQHPSYLSTSPSLLKKIRHKTLGHGHGDFNALKFS